MTKKDHEESGLSKSVWSDADLEEMGWHDATVHALFLQPGEMASRLLLDLDYPVRWVPPVRRRDPFTFWVAPATLVFEEVWDLEGSLDFKGLAPELELDGIHRLAPPDGRAEYPLWHLEGHAFELKFRASGFRQYFRQAPRHVAGPMLEYADRGGCAFTEVGFD
ncbi:hypothetical protein AB0O91_06265 [Kitasatospora sp. NPDC089797]|uniref:hypothetical protein n=1 Tax=Kitasatospora sp. NPDC089797 TaxID=3155298 RepID=UPI00341AD7B0